MTAPIDRARLRALAAASAGGDWLDKEDLGWHSIPRGDVRYIIAASPDTLLALLDALDAAERERDGANERASQWVRIAGELGADKDALKADRDALAADARRYRWLRDWMERRHLIRSEFCKPPDDAPVGDYVLIWTPYGTSKPIGWGLTADEAIDRAMRDDALDGAKGK